MPSIVMNYHFAGFCTSIGLWFHPSHFHTLCEFKFNWLEPAKRSQMKAQQIKADNQICRLDRQHSSVLMKCKLHV